MYIAIAPLGTPTGTLPAIEEKMAKSKNVQLLLEQQVYVNGFQKKMKSLKKRLPPKVDEALEQRCPDDMNVDRIKTIIRESDMIWGDKGLSAEEKIRRLYPLQIGTFLSRHGRYVCRTFPICRY